MACILLRQPSPGRHPREGRSATRSCGAGGSPDADIARGLELRHDWGPQYRSAHFTGSRAWLGISDDPAFLGEPETNGCAERWIRTLKDQFLWVQLYDAVDQLRQAVTSFVDRYNSRKHGSSHREFRAGGAGNGRLA
jgi:transposase InsO family protein